MINETKLRNIIKKVIKENFMEFEKEYLYDDYEPNNSISKKTPRLIKERPWAVECKFSLSDGIAYESEGLSADGMVISLSGESGKTMNVIVDSYWNPHKGDESGNSLKVQIDGIDLKDVTSYVPVKFESGVGQKIVISNSPVTGLIYIAYAKSENDIPIVFLNVKNPFKINEGVKFSTKNLGNGEYEAELKFCSL